VTTTLSNGSRTLRGPVLAAFGGFASFYLLLSVVPQYAVDGGAGPAGAGLCTGALMLATVAVQPLTPRLLATAGRRMTLASAGALLGLPCLLLPLSANLTFLVVLGAVRGLGFGIFVVVSVTLVAERVPEGRWGRGMGLYGALVGLAGIIGSPLGLAMARRAAYPWTFLLAGCSALIVVGASLGVGSGRVAPAAGPRSRVPVGGALRALCAPFLVEAVSTTAYGVIFTFLPLAAAHGPAWTGPTALLVVQLTAAVSRWVSGGIVDRYGGGRLLGPAILAAAIGVTAGVAPGDPGVMIAGMALFGAGFGVIQNASLVLTLHRARDFGLGVGSVTWNLAFDAGTGIGAAGGGLVAQAGGNSAVFLSASLLLALSLTAARAPR
jgi:predicted MFS family arabinose efflux permease